MTKKILIVFGTRFGSTRYSANKLSNEIKKLGLQTKIIDLKKDKWVSPKDYDGLIVGVSIAMFRWAKEPSKYLKKFKKEITMPLGIFISSAMSVAEREGAIKKFLDPEAEKIGIKYNLADGFGMYSDLSKSYGLKTGILKSMVMGFSKDQNKEYKPKGINDFLHYDRIKKFAKDFSKLIKK